MSNDSTLLLKLFRSSTLPKLSIKLIFQAGMRHLRFLQQKGWTLVFLCCCIQKSDFQIKKELGLSLPNNFLQNFKQQQDNWCWASATQMAIFFNKNQYWPQCQIVSQIHSLNCCEANPDSRCSEAYFTSKSLKHFGIPYQHSVPGLRQAIHSLNQGYWVVSKWQHRFERRAHLWVLLSVEKFDNNIYLKIFDPETGLRKISLKTDFLNWSRRYRWKESFLIKGA